MTSSTRKERRSSRAPSLAWRVAVAIAFALALSGLATQRASASPDTLRLALEDLTFGAVDVAAAPVTGGIATAKNLDAVSDSVVLQGLSTLPSWIGLTLLQVGQGTLRLVVGAVELVPGLLLFPFPDVDVPEGFNVFRQGDPLVDLRNPLAETPAWLPWVPPATPFTIDARIAPVSPWAIYGGDYQGMEGAYGDTSMAGAR